MIIKGKVSPGRRKHVCRKHADANEPPHVSSVLGFCQNGKQMVADGTEEDGTGFVQVTARRSGRSRPLRVLHPFTSSVSKALHKCQGFFDLAFDLALDPGRAPWENALFDSLSIRSACYVLGWVALGWAVLDLFLLETHVLPRQDTPQLYAK